MTEFRQELSLVADYVSDLSKLAFAKAKAAMIVDSENKIKDIAAIFTEKRARHERLEMRTTLSIYVNNTTCS